MDADWRVTPVTARLKDRAWAQLGTSGSGNHFVEFGVLTVLDDAAGLPPGKYLALLSHSGSRGTGAADRGALQQARARPRIPSCRRSCAARVARSRRPRPGQEYWAAMELMGRYAAANHALIHAHIARALGVEVLLDLENHHNFAWRERHRLPDGTERGGDRASQGRDAGGRGRARHHPGLDGHAGLRRARQGVGGIAQLGVARRRPAHEPHQGEGAVHLGRSRSAC